MPRFNGGAFLWRSFTKFFICIQVFMALEIAYIPVMQ